MPFNSRHVLVAAALHIVLFTFLFVGASCHEAPTAPAVIEALVITGKNKSGEKITEPPPKQVEPTPEPPKPEPPKPEPPKPEPPKPEPPKPDPVVEKKKQEEQVKKQEEAKKKIEQERIKREELLKEQAEIQRQKAEEERIKKLEEDRRKAEEEAKRKAEEEEKKRKAEEEARRIAEEKRQKALEEARLKQQMEDSLAQEARDRAEAARIGEIQKTWQQVLADHIASNWLRSPGLPSQLYCKVEINLLPNGEVVNAKIVQSSGNPSFDNSVLNAVYKSSPMPLPQDPKAFVPLLRPGFTPESLSR
jgi:colicin import membrane protein